jgi:hypothetical protein
MAEMTMSDQGYWRGITVNVAFIAGIVERGHQWQKENPRKRWPSSNNSPQ